MVNALVWVLVSAVREAGAVAVKDFDAREAVARVLLAAARVA